MKSVYLQIEGVALASAVYCELRLFLFLEGSLFKRDIHSKRNLFMYMLLKTSIFVVVFTPFVWLSNWSIPFLALYYISFIRNYELYNGRPSLLFHKLSIWKKVAEWSGSAIVVSTPLPETQYMFACHPHGVLPLGVCLALGTYAMHIDQLLPQIHFRGVAVSCCYVIPLYRDLCLAAGGTDCRLQTIEHVIEGGCSPVVLPGGADESLLTISHKNRVLVHHKGFIRVAIRYGLPIVPCYSFGENNWWHINEDAQPNQWMNRITKQFLGIRVPPISYLWPTNTRIKLVFGAPIDVKRTENPSEEYVDSIHMAYVAELKRVFAEYQPKGEEDIEVV